MLKSSEKKPIFKNRQSALNKGKGLLFEQDDILDHKTPQSEQTINSIESGEKSGLYKTTPGIVDKGTCLSFSFKHYY